MNQGFAILLPLIVFWVFDLIVFINSIRNRLEERVHRIFRGLSFFVLMMQSFSVVLYASDLHLIEVGKSILDVSAIIGMTMMTASAAFWFRYLVELVPGKIRNLRALSFVYEIPLLVILVVGICSIWTKWLFYFDSNNVYHGGPLFVLQIICPFVYAFFGLVVLCSEIRNKNEKNIYKLLTNFALFFIPSAVGTFVQLFVFRGGYTQMGISFGLVFMYFEQYIGEISEINRLKSVERLNERLKELNDEQNKFVDHITELYSQLQENQAQMEEYASEQELQLKEIQCLNKSLENQISINKSMSSVYYSAYCIDVKEDSFFEINSKEGIRNVVGIAGKAQDTFNSMCKSIIEPEFTEVMTEFVQLSTLDERMRGKQFITCEYKGKLSGWSQAYFIAGEKDEDGKLIRVYYATKINNDEKEREDEAKAVIEGLSSEYHSVWLIDKNTLKIKLIRQREEESILEASKIGRENDDYVSASKLYIQNYIVEEDRERVSKELAADVILKHINSSRDIFSTNYLRKKPNGEVTYHQVAFVDATTETGKEQFVMGFRDVDKLVKAEQMKKKELEEARRTAESASQAKTVFLNNMSHDIRTPMNAILGFTDLIENAKDNPEKISDYIKKLKSSGEYLLTIINNVLDIARIESGKVLVDESFMDLSSVESSAIPIFEDLIRQKKLTLNASMDIQHKYVLLDRTKTQQITVNLLGNAVKYTPEGGTINMTMKEVPCKREGFGTYILIVSDTGIGMTKEFTEHIFDYFARERNTTESRIAGTGLGMSIVKNYVELMGGTIEVESEVGKGTTFTVTIDHKIIQNPDEYMKEQLSETYDSKKLLGKRVLIVEDNDLNAEIASALLEDAGINVERAEDGVCCIKMITEAPEDYYDVVLMDIQMPNLNGYDATRRIRQLENKKKASVPIIATTANAFEEDKQKALESGMNGHISKPIELQKLLNAIAKI